MFQAIFTFTLVLGHGSSARSNLEACASVLTDELPAITSVGIPSLGRGCPAISPQNHYFTRGFENTGCGNKAIEIQTDAGLKCVTEGSTNATISFSV